MTEAATATAPAVAQPQVLHVALAKILVRPNPRVQNDDAAKAAQAALNASVAERGVITPILLRPANGSGEFELVAGSRRYKAALAAKHEDIPAYVRELSDRDVAVVQLIENLQRADLHPIDEADAFKRLVDDHGFSTADIVAQTGKSAQYVAQRQQLTVLTADARKAFLSGKLMPGVAFILARIRNPKQQAEALKDFLDWKKQRGHEITTGDASHLVRSKYMLRLVNAPFPTADAKLVPAAGACGACPKRTGNAKDLFTDVQEDDTCSDPTCHAEKATAYRAVQIKEAKDRGFKVLTGKAAEAVIPQYSTYVNPSSGYVPADEKHTSGKTYRTLAGGKGAKLTLVESARTGQLVECIAIADSPDLTKLLKNASGKIKRNATRTADDTKRLEMERAVKDERKMREATYRAIGAKFDGKLSPELIALCAVRMFKDLGHETRGYFRKLVDPEGKDDTGYQWGDKFEKHIPKLTTAQHGQIMVMAALSNHLHTQWYHGASTKVERDATLDGVAKLLGLDLDGVRKAALVKGAKALPAPAAPKAEAEKKPTTAERGRKLVTVGEINPDDRKDATPKPVPPKAPTPKGTPKRPVKPPKVKRAKAEAKPATATTH